MLNFRNRSIYTFLILLLSVVALMYVFPVYAQEGGDGGAIHGADAAVTFLWIAVILIIAKLVSLIERIGQPAVLGELVVGIVLGNLALLGIHVFEPIKADSIIAFLAELGLVILLFQIGLETNIKRMTKVGGRALSVAIVGVIAPFVLGAYIVGPWLLPDLDSNAHLFIGAALVATSIGVTVRIFRDLGKSQTPEAQIILGAAVFDDVIGLIILAVISALVVVEALTIGIVGWIIAKALLFLIGSIVLGQFLAPHLGKLLSKISPTIGMKFTMAISLGLIFAFLAQKVGLAPIIGAFAAGLILDPVHFRHFKNPELVDEITKVVQSAPGKVKERILKVVDRHADKHIEDLIEPLAFFFVPIFFVMTGMSVRLDVLSNPTVLLAALGITAAAIVGKVVAGMAAGNVNKALVGWGMVPRAGVELAFVTLGRSLGILSDELFAIIIFMVIVTTLITPPIITILLKRQSVKAT